MSDSAIKAVRIEWIDSLKGFSILWLVVYHFYIFDWLISPVFVFFFLSGMFYSDGKSFVSFLQKKTIALIVPFLFFWALGILASWIGAKLGAGSVYNIRNILLFFSLIPLDATMQNPIGVGAIWFLLSLFELYVIMYGLRKVSKSTVWLVIVAILSTVMASFLQSRYAMGSLFYFIYTLGFLPYFISGYLLKRFLIDGEKDCVIFILSLLIVVITFFVNSIGVIGFLRDRVWGIGTVLLLVFLFKRLSDINRMKGLIHIMTFHGRNSLTILGTHVLVMGGGKTIAKSFYGRMCCLLHYIVCTNCFIMRCCSSIIQ